MKVRITAARLGLLTSASLLLTASPVSAQVVGDAATTPSAAGAVAPPAGTPVAPTSTASAAGIGDIVVTARKRNERLQDVPVAITAIDSAAITKSGAVTLTDLSGLAPSASLQNFAIFPFNLTAVIRGIGTADFEPSSDPAVAVFIDGVYQPSSNGAAVGLLDTENVQILRGPQGTLFGRNATAGAILITTKRPKDEFGLEAQATVGNYGALDLAAAVTGPLIPGKLDFRISGSTDSLDGYYHNYDGRQLGKKDVYSFSPSLLFTPTPDLKIYLTGTYAQDHSQTIPGINGYPPFGGEEGANQSDYDTTINEKLNFHSTTKAVTLNADYRTDIGTFTLIAGYRKFNYFGNFDVDASPLTVLAVDRSESHNQKSIEGRYASSFEGKFNFVTGLLYIDHKYDLNYNGRSAALIPGLDPTSPGLPALVVSNSQDSKTLSAYLQGTYKFTDRLSLDAGVNFGHEKKNFDFKAATVFFVPATPETLQKSWNNLGPKVGLNFKANKDVLIYATYSRGFRSGGFSGRAFDPRNLGPYAPEKVDAFEVGAKTEFLDHKLRVNVSAYYNKYKDLQRPFPNLVGYNGTAPNPLELITFNAAGANIKGFEGEITALPLRGLTLNLSGDYLDAKYSGFKDPASGASLDYLKLVYAPKWTGRAAATYHTAINDRWYGELSGDFEYNSAQETDTLNATVGHRDPTKIVNASLSFGQSNGPLMLTLFVKNLTKDVYVVSAQAGAPFFNIFTVNPPRTYGLTASVKF